MPSKSTARNGDPDCMKLRCSRHQSAFQSDQSRRGAALDTRRKRAQGCTCAVGAREGADVDGSCPADRGPRRAPPLVSRAAWLAAQTSRSFRPAANHSCHLDNRHSPPEELSQHPAKVTQKSNKGVGSNPPFKCHRHIPQAGMIFVREDPKTNWNGTAWVEEMPRLCRREKVPKRNCKASCNQKRSMPVTMGRATLRESVPSGPMLASAASCRTGASLSGSTQSALCARGSIRAAEESSCASTAADSSPPAPAHHRLI